MSTKNQFGTADGARNEPAGPIAAGECAEQDTVAKQALDNFRLSVHAWSEAAYRSVRTAERTVRHRSWRLAAGWAMAGVLVAGGVTGGVFEHAHRQRAAAAVAAQQQQARRQQLAAARQRQQDQKLMATVDSEISQEVPSAMEPLADLMEDSGNQ